MPAVVTEWKYACFGYCRYCTNASARLRTPVVDPPLRMLEHPRFCIRCAQRFEQLIAERPQSSVEALIDEMTSGR